MKLPLSWLNEFVKIDEPVEKLADRLLNIGFEVEEIIRQGEDIQNVVTGKITKITKHPNADKLLICDTEINGKVTVIVTGANNVFEGAVVPVALPGAVLPNGKNIAEADLKGVMSYGMFCSGTELNIDDNVIDGAEVNGILILDKDIKTGQDIKKVLALDEVILDISLTANRPDCQSIYGISREIAAFYGQELVKPKITYTVSPSKSKKIPATIQNKTSCDYYTGHIVDNIKVEKSPKWLRDRLRFCGIRAINNIVDITNYVLLEIGQPLHAFDTRFINDEIIVRNAKKGEKITALDGNEYSLSEDMLVIADLKKPIAIAGVMGGEYSGIMSDTKTVFLEAARFKKGGVRRTSRKLGLRSDSSARYEKGVDLYSVDFGRDRALSLFEMLSAGTISNVYTEDFLEKNDKKVIETTIDAINKLLGITVPEKRITEILTALEFEVKKSDDKLICTVPKFREDVDNYTDLAEEVIRYYGYDNLTDGNMASTVPTTGGMSIKQANIENIRNILWANNCLEVLTYSFINPTSLDKLMLDKNDKRRNAIEIRNPLSAEYSTMRTQNISSILECAASNVSKKNDDFRLFEVARKYVPDTLPLKKLPSENDVLTLVFVGKNEDYYSIKSTLRNIIDVYVKDYTLKYSAENFIHPGMSADIFCGKENIGYMGKIHPEVAKNYSLPEYTFVAEVDLTKYISVPLSLAKFTPISKYPTVNRDIAVVVDDKFTVGELQSTIMSVAPSFIESVEMFDIYKGEKIAAGKKSVAFSIKIQSYDKTLVDSEINNIMNNIIEVLNKTYGASLRQ